jgi:hypothetical protein
MNPPGVMPEAARIARQRLAERLRQLASGRITNDEFDNNACRGSGETPDGAAWEVYRFAWCFYDDLYQHRLRGRNRLSPMQRRAFARCVLFLRTELPYEWPKRAKWLWCGQRCKQEPAARLPWWKPDESVFGGLVWARRVREWRRRREMEHDRLVKVSKVDDRIWPFRRMADYKAALKNPPYLAGRATA